MLPQDCDDIGLPHKSQKAHQLADGALRVSVLSAVCRLVSLAIQSSSSSIDTFALQGLLSSQLQAYRQDSPLGVALSVELRDFDG